MGHVVYSLGFPDVHIKKPCWLLCPGDWSLYYPLRKGFTLVSGRMKRILQETSHTRNEQVSFLIKRYFIFQSTGSTWQRPFQKIPHFN